MEIICTQENLQKAIQNIERIAGKNASLPILENILFETKKGRLQLSSTNLDLGITVNIGVKIVQEGKIAVSARVVAQCIANLSPSETVRIFSRDFDMHIESGTHMSTIKGVDPQEYPLIPSGKDVKKKIQFNAQHLKDAFSKGIVSVATNDARIEFTGIYMAMKERRVVLVSTDSFRLTEIFISPLKVFGLEEEMFEWIIPYQTIAEVLRLLSPQIENIEVWYEEGQIFFIWEDIMIVSRLINGKFPDYQQIIPSQSKTTVILSRQECIQAIRLASVFSDTRSGEVVFTIKCGENQLILHSESTQSGVNTSTLQAQCSGEDMSIVFNPRYILDGLSLYSEENIIFMLNASSMPVVIRGENYSSQTQNGYQYVVMPIRK